MACQCGRELISRRRVFMRAPELGKHLVFRALPALPVLAPVPVAAEPLARVQVNGRVRDGQRHRSILDATRQTLAHRRQVRLKRQPNLILASPRDGIRPALHLLNRRRRPLERIGSSQCRGRHAVHREGQHRDARLCQQRLHVSRNALPT